LYGLIPLVVMCFGVRWWGNGAFFGYLSGFVHCFVGYWIAFLHISGSKLGRSGVVFIEICGKWGLIGVPPLPPVSGYTRVDVRINN